jgi:RimJ/RimL family protein N-acetyltransferase/ribosomal protein S18 acetylase RimI-like enzyme
MIERIREFRHAVEERVAERRVATPHGTALLVDTLREIYDLNYLRAERMAAFETLAAEAEAPLRNCFHRRVIVETGGDAVVDDAVAAGWSSVPHLIMAHRRAPDRVAETSMVREVAFDDLVPARLAVTTGEPWGDPEIAHLLDEGKRRIMAAVETRFLAAFADGRIAAYCELRGDGGTAQIEDVNTLPGFRGRGLGRAVVQAAVDDARRSHDLVFLEALEEDWPRDLYAKLGFDIVGKRHFLTRFPHPFTRLRVRTPRLELRLATDAELEELARVALAGIHPVDEMPFEYAWTDGLTRESFLAYHHDRIGHADAEEWHLPLVVFDGGRPIGVQELHATSFPRTRRLGTGSWLGREWQGRGIGTEMRAAVLTLAFDLLGAEVAVSGALEGNTRSLAVSRKLGYAVVGSHAVSPRGEPSEHIDLELRRDDFVSPVSVEVVGLEGVLPVLGLA